MTRSTRTGLLLALCALAMSPAAFAQQHDMPAMHDMHAMMDADGDGAISAAEHAAGAQKMFQMADANGDGSISADEMQAMHGRMMGGHAMGGHAMGHAMMDHGDKACDCPCKTDADAGEAPAAPAGHAAHH